jgi:hypothetical protein
MKRRNRVEIFLIAALAAASAFGQMAGNPLMVRGAGELTISAMGSLADHDEFLSKRLLLKSAWGVTSFMDVYGLAGIADLEMQRSGIEPFEGEMAMAFGAGFTIAGRLFDDPAWEFWGGAQILRFPSSGSYRDFQQNLEFLMEYDWREVQGYGGIAYRVGPMRLYAGGALWSLQRIEERPAVYVIDRDGERLFRTSDPHVESTYQSGVWTGGILGLEFILPQRYAVVLECLAFNENNYQIRLGVCQTGILPW